MYDSFIRENSNILKDYLLKKYNLKENVTIEKGTISDVEFYTSLPLKIAKKIKKTPMEIANEFSSLKFFGIKKIEVAPPGFLNFYLIDGIYLDYFNSFSVNKHNKNGKKINIEFISANPTGPFNVVSGRAAAYGMALSNLFEYLGWSVTKEYYINDAGRQVNIFANSIYKAYQKKYESRNVEFDEGEYNNPYIYELADIFKSRISDSNDPIELLKKIALKETNDTNKKFLKDIGLEFDIWFSEKSLYDSNKHKNYVLKTLEKKRLLYEKDNALFIKNTELGDSQDWVLKKSNGDYTYLFGDIMYHINKYQRGFDRAINIWGPDHISGVKRLKKALTAFGIPEDFLEVIILQQVELIKGGKKVTMSKRSGNYVTLKEVIDSVGSDAAKYYFLSKTASQHIEFSLDSFEKDNEKSPIFYLQYMFARINGVILKANSLEEPRKITTLLNSEKSIIYNLFLFESIINESVQKMEPSLVITYLSKIATEFHKFYHNNKIIGNENEEELLNFIKKLGIFIKEVLNLLGFTAPERM